MSFPSPEDPARAPVWENYVVAQAVQASLGLIPPNALAIGVKVDGPHVQLRIQLSELSEQDAEDIADIVDDLQTLVGDAVSVGVAHEVRDRREISLGDGVRWIFLAR